MLGEEAPNNKEGKQGTDQSVIVPRWFQANQVTHRGQGGTEPRLVYIS